MKALTTKLMALVPAMILGLGSAACSSSGSDNTAQATGKLEIFSWFTAGSEKAALDKLIAEFLKENPGIKASDVTNAAQQDSQHARDLLATRMTKSQPPDSFQVISGADILSWVDKGALEPIDSIAASENWASAFPQEVRDSVSKDGVQYGVPLDIERDNTLFYNAKLLSDNKLGPTDIASIDGMLSAAAKLKAAGVTPFSMPGSAGWAMASVVFESVFVAQAGPDFYQSYLTGGATANDSKVSAALDTVAKMLDFSDPAATGANGWTDTVKAVCQGNAAMVMLPDFIKGEFQNQCPDLVQAGTIGYVPVQGTTPTFVFVSVTFELPKGAPDRDSAVAFLKTVGSKAGQEAFNPTKGSIGGRKDLDLTKFDAISQGTLKDFTSGAKLVPAYAALTTGDFQTAVNPALAAFSNPTTSDYKNTDKVMAVIQGAYAKVH